MRESCTVKKRGAKKRQTLERFSEAACRKEADGKLPGSEKGESYREEDGGAEQIG